MRMLPLQSIDINCHDENGKNLLAIAIEKGSAPLTKLFIERGAQLDPKDKIDIQNVFFGLIIYHASSKSKPDTAVKEVNKDSVSTTRS